MSAYNYPRVYNYIAQMCAASPDLRNLFEQLENELKQKEELSIYKMQVNKDMKNLQVDLMLLRQATCAMQENRRQIVNVESILESSYGHLLEIRSLLCDNKMKNMMHYGILRKQNEVQEKLNQMDEMQRRDFEYKSGMENRICVQEFRKWQKALQFAKEENDRIELESKELDSQWRIRIERATQQRNSKIVALVEINKELLELQQPLLRRKYFEGNKNADKAAIQRGNSAPIALQSASDFLKNYPVQATQKDKCVQKTVTPQLQSILVASRSEECANVSISPPKQVHFAELPSPVHVPQMDINEESSGSNSSEYFNIQDLPERAIVQKVEILPPLDMNFNPKTDTLDDVLSFHNLDLGGNLMASQQSDDAIDIDDNSDNGSEQETYQQPMEEDSGSGNANDSNGLQFSAPVSKPCDDFFLNFDENSDGRADDGHSYEL